MIGQIVALHHFEGFVDAWVEGGSNSLYRLNIQRAQRFFHLFDDQLDAGAELFGRPGGFKGKLEVVQHGEKLLDGTGDGVVTKLGTFL